MRQVFVAALEVEDRALDELILHYEQQPMQDGKAIFWIRFKDRTAAEFGLAKLNASLGPLNVHTYWAKKPLLLPGERRESQESLADSGAGPSAIAPVGSVLFIGMLTPDEDAAKIMCLFPKCCGLNLVEGKEDWKKGHAFVYFRTADDAEVAWGFVLRVSFSHSHCTVSCLVCIALSHIMCLNCILCA